MRYALEGMALWFCMLSILRSEYIVKMSVHRDLGEIGMGGRGHTCGAAARGRRAGHIYALFDHHATRSRRAPVPRNPGPDYAILSREYGRIAGRCQNQATMAESPEGPRRSRVTGAEP